MADTLESLEIKVVHSASGADAEISNLASAIGRLKTAITGAPAALKELASAVKALHDACKGGTAKFDKFAESMANVAASAELIGGNSENMKTLAEAMNTMSGVKLTAGAFNSLSKGVESVGTAAKTITPEAIENLDKMVTSLAKLQGVDLQGLGSAMNTVRRGGNIKPAETPTPVPQELQDIISSASAIDVLEAKLESLRIAMDEAFASGNTDKAYQLRAQILQTEAALEKAKKAAEGAAKGVKEVAKEAKKSQTPLSNFISSLKRIAMYRILRSIIKSITQAFQEGLEKAYIFSAGIDGQGHRFAEAMDNIKSSTNAMKGQLGSAFIGLLAAIQPILITIINLVTKVADAISQLFAAFTGRTYLKANATAAQFADTMARGGAAAKEWKNQLLSFDEINRLNEPNQGGGGSAANPLDGFSFEDTPIAEFWQNLASKLSPIVEQIKLMFEGLVEVVDALLRGDWDGVFKGAAKVVEHFSSAVALTLGLAKTPINSFFNFATEKIKQLGDKLDEKFGTDGVFSRISYGVVFAMNVIRYTIESVIGKLQFAIEGFGKVVSDVLRGDWDAAWEDARTVLLGVSVDIDDEIIKMARTATNELFGLDEKTRTHMDGVSKSIGNAKQPASDLSAAFSAGLSAAGNASADMAEAVSANMQAVRDQIEATASTSIHGESNGKGISFSATIGRAWSTIKRIFSGGFASGGFPDEGQLFMAREAGPELVGTMGGHTAVANNQEIVEGIRQGVYDAVVAANGNGNSEVNVKVYLDSREIKAGQERLARAWG